MPPTRAALCIAALALLHCAGWDGATPWPAALPPSKPTSDPNEEIEIGEITVFNQKVLPEEDPLAWLVNNLHYTTTRETIAAELNFRSGSRIRRWELYDAERYIRMLDPIKQAKVVAVPNPQTGKIDILVLTEDRLSAYVRGGGAGSGGYASFGFEVGESSLLGRLYSINASYTRENFRDFYGVRVGKQRIAGSRWEFFAGTLGGFVGTAQNFSAHSFSLRHPFLIDGQRHSVNLEARFARGVGYEFFGGGIRRGLDPESGQVFELIQRRRHENVAFDYLYGIGKKERIELGAGFLHLLQTTYFIFPRDQFVLGDTPARPLSTSALRLYQYEQFATRALTFSLNTRWGDFVPMQNFRRYLFTEDQFAGFRSALRLLRAHPALGLADDYTKVSAALTYSDNYGQQRWRIEVGAGRTATFWSQRYALPRDDMWNADLRLFRFAPWGTLALRQYMAAGNNLSIAARNQIAAEFSRGFIFGALFPQAGVLTSCEYRSPALRLPYILLAGVLFFDHAGTGNSLHALRWNAIAGFGLRSMLYAFDNSVFRLDVGYNLTAGEFNLLNALQFGLDHTF
ncbi:MAG: hypothetical protein N2Z22_01810 [Turneriella sp.]|nr:hypothetical protein [Turneriella sp.]